MMLRCAKSVYRNRLGVSATIAGATSTSVLFSNGWFSPGPFQTSLDTTTSKSFSTETTTSVDSSSGFATKPLPTRNEQLTRLKSGVEFDVLVVGGGATGSGTALDAQLRGLSTALIERGDFSSETSSRSTKLIWAGIRYIATAIASLLRPSTLLHPIDGLKDFYSEFRMVLNCHKERRLLLENNPHLTHWVPIAIPLTSWTVRPAPFGNDLFSIAPMVFPLVMKFYDSLCGFNCPPSHIMGKSRARRKFPQLDEDFKYVQVFYEGSHNDARTATCIALTAAEEGAAVANYTEMIGTIKDNDDNGKVVGIKCRDNLTNETFDVRAKSIIFAGGPFTDELREIEDEQFKPAVAAAAGTHIVLPGYYAPNGIGMLDFNTSDGRFLFFLPWQGSVIVGTTDRKGQPVSSPGPPEEEIRWILSEVEKYLSDDLKVRRADVLSAWQGWRPLASDPHAPPGAPVSRDHVISTNPQSGITFITGGKWTTYREMAEEVLDTVIKSNPALANKAKPCQTQTRPLRGGIGYSKNLPIKLIQKYGVSEDTAKHLASTYGVNAFDVCELTRPSGKRWPKFGHVLIENYPYLDCEVEYACTNEMAVSVKDMLTLRMRLAYLNSEAAKEVAPKVAELMGRALGWSKKEKKRQLEEAMEYFNQFGGPMPNKSVLMTLPTKMDIKSIFQLFDIDDNGYIDFEEMKSVAKELGHNFSNDEEAMKAFIKMDSEKNGRVTFDNFSIWWEKTGKEDALRKKLGDKFAYNFDKAGTGPESRGVAFG